MVEELSEISIVRRRPAVVIGVPVLARFDELSELVPLAWAEAFRRFDGPLAEASTRVGDRYHEVVGLLGEVDAQVDGAVHALVPAGEYATATHRGDRVSIAESFGRIESWIAAQGREVGAGKLDVGYLRDGSERAHDLYVSIRPAHHG
ncbi:hypothetical protein ACGGZK_05690 [Agromyces sp. MMS24-K17]|uniref:hypothetical protein n=1 Tax=Agromyces sp. MMS24-K17 TaxID=3372850 RepID=UPI0037552A60